ncbi:protein YgfX [Aeromonas mytilicola]
MPVIPSRRQRLLLLALFLLLLWPVAALIHGWQWGLFLPCWLLGLWLARPPRTPGPPAPRRGRAWVVWQGRRHRLDYRSRILPGVLWLRLVTEVGAERHLWLFSDALAPEHYRALARAIHLAPSNPPASPHNR